MDDRNILDNIGQLVDQEHKLEERQVAEGLSDDEVAELKDIEVQLDRCWDLLRQRRARRAAGLDPEGASTRSADVVEGYRQ